VRTFQCALGPRHHRFHSTPLSIHFLCRSYYNLKNYNLHNPVYSFSPRRHHRFSLHAVNPTPHKAFPSQSLFVFEPVGYASSASGLHTPASSVSPDPSLPPGSATSSARNAIKEVIKIHQHEFFRAIPQPAALPACSIGSVPPLFPPHPDRPPIYYLEVYDYAGIA